MKRLQITYKADTEPGLADDLREFFSAADVDATIEELPDVSGDEFCNGCRRPVHRDAPYFATPDGTYCESCVPDDIRKEMQ